MLDGEMSPLAKRFSRGPTARDNPSRMAATSGRIATADRSRIAPTFFSKSLGWSLPCGARIALACGYRRARNSTACRTATPATKQLLRTDRMARPEKAVPNKLKISLYHRHGFPQAISLNKTLICQTTNQKFSSYCAKPGSSFRSWLLSSRKRKAAGTRPKALPSPFSSNPPGSLLVSAKKKRGTFFGPSPRAISTECWLSNDNGVPTATRTGWAMLSFPFWPPRSLPGKSDEITGGRWAKPLTAMNARC
jgi:hypothetical protein